MKAIEYARFGGPEELELKDVPTPVPAHDEILIRVHAAAVNPEDWKILGGHMRLLIKGSVPRRGGCEFAGHVEQAGASVRQFSIGDAVVGVLDAFRSRQGAFAEYVSVAESDTVVRVPNGLSLPDAAALPVAGMSALDCLRRLGDAKAGQRVLITGAAGGVGSFAVQLARLWDLHVTAVCREANSAFVRELGAHAVVAYDRADPLRINETFDLIVDAAAKYSYVSHTFPLAQTRAAYELSRTEHARGKIVVLVDGAGRVN